MNCSRQCFTNFELRNFTYLNMTDLNFGIGETVCSEKFKIEGFVVDLKL